MKRNKEGQIMKRGGTGFEIGAGVLIIIESILRDPKLQLTLARRLTGKVQYTMTQYANIFIAYIILRSFSNSLKYYPRTTNDKERSHNYSDDSDDSGIVPGFAMEGGTSKETTDFMDAFSPQKNTELIDLGKLNRLCLYKLKNGVIVQCTGTGKGEEKKCQMFKIWLYNTIINFIYFIPKEKRTPEEKEIIKHLVVKRDIHISKSGDELRGVFQPNPDVIPGVTVTQRVPKFEFKLRSNNSDKTEIDEYDALKTIGQEIDNNIQFKGQAEEFIGFLTNGNLPTKSMNQYFETVKNSRSFFCECLDNPLYKSIYLKIMATINLFFDEFSPISNFFKYLIDNYKDYRLLTDKSKQFYKLLNSFKIKPVLSDTSISKLGYRERSPPKDTEILDMLTTQKDFY